MGKAAKEAAKPPKFLKEIVEENGVLVEKVYKKKLGRPRKNVDLLSNYVPASVEELPPEPELKVEKGEVYEVDQAQSKELWKAGSPIVEEFLSSSEDEVLMSGGRGSGKSAALIVDPLRYCNNGNFRGLVLRHTMVELRELISRAQDLYPKLFPGVKYQRSTYTFNFPSGARIEFGYCDKLPDDLEQYKGQEYQWLGLDELTQWASEEIIEKMRGSMRTTDPTLPISVRACVDQGEVLTSNRGWVDVTEVTTDDTVYSVTEKGDLVVNPVTGVYVYPVEEELVRVRKKNLFMSFTNDHRIGLKHPNSSKIHFKKFCDIETKSFDVVRSPVWHDPKTSYTAQVFKDTDPTDWICFLGLWLAEGCIKQKVINGNYSVIVTQLKAATRPLVRNLLKRIGGVKWHETKNGDFTAHCKELWQILRPFGKAKNKYVPQDVLQTASREQLELLLFWLFLGDGHWVKKGVAGSYTSTSKTLADNVAEIGVRLGYKVQVSCQEFDNKNWNTRYNVYLSPPMISPTTRVERPRNDVHFETYKGNVYCISVANNDNFVLRQQGTVWVSGNTSNPDGPGRLWVKERFIDAAPSGKTAVFAYETPIGKQYVTRKWLHSTVYDNPFILENNPSYVGWLHSLKGRLREVWLDGSWDAADGMAYDDFDRRIHVIKPFEVPSSWPRFCAVDWGYGASSLAVCLWFAIDHEGHIYVYREFVANGPVPVEQKLTASQFARRLSEIEKAEKDWTSYTVIDGGTNQDHGASGITGNAAPTIFEQMRKATPMRKWRLAKKGKGSRAAGKQIIHDLLAIDPYLNKPKLQFFNTCVQVIKELSSLPLDPHNPEDSDPKCPDDAVDCLRYGLTSRPTQGLVWDPTRPQQIRKYNPPINYN